MRNPANRFGGQSLGQNLVLKQTEPPSLSLQTLLEYGEQPVPAITPEAVTDESKEAVLALGDLAAATNKLRDLRQDLYSAYLVLCARGHDSRQALSLWQQRTNTLGPGAGAMVMLSNGLFADATSLAQHVRHNNMGILPKAMTKEFVLAHAAHKNQTETEAWGLALQSPSPEDVKWLFAVMKQNKLDTTGLQSAYSSLLGKQSLKEPVVLSRQSQRLVSAICAVAVAAGGDSVLKHQVPRVAWTKALISKGKPEDVINAAVVLASAAAPECQERVARCLERLIYALRPFDAVKLLRELDKVGLTDAELWVLVSERLARESSLGQQGRDLAKLVGLEAKQLSQVSTMLAMESAQKSTTKLKLLNDKRQQLQNELYKHAGLDRHSKQVTGQRQPRKLYETQLAMQELNRETEQAKAEAELAQSRLPKVRQTTLQAELASCETDRDRLDLALGSIAAGETFPLQVTLAVWRAARACVPDKITPEELSELWEATTRADCKKIGPRLSILRTAAECAAATGATTCLLAIFKDAAQKWEVPRVPRILQEVGIAATRRSDLGMPRREIKMNELSPGVWDWEADYTWLCSLINSS